MPVDNGVSLATVVRAKTSNESVDTSTALQDDDMLQFNVGANEQWAIEICLLVDFNTAGQIKVGIDSPAVNFITVAAEMIANGATPAFGLAAAIATGVSLVVVGATTGMVKMSVAFANGATAGTFKLQWAQAVSNAGATTVKAGSYLVAHRIS